VEPGDEHRGFGRQHGGDGEISAHGKQVTGRLSSTVRATFADSGRAVCVLSVPV
jgi:hypothetical protein